MVMATVVNVANGTTGKRSRDKYRGKYEGNGHNGPETSLMARRLLL